MVIAERGRRPRITGRVLISQPPGALYSLSASVESADLRQTSVIRGRDLRADGVIAERLGLERLRRPCRSGHGRRPRGEAVHLPLITGPRA